MKRGKGRKLIYTDYTKNKEQQLLGLKGIEDSNNGLSSLYQYLVNQQEYIGDFQNAEQKQGEKLNLPFLSASEKEKK